MLRISAPQHHSALRKDGSLVGSRHEVGHGPRDGRVIIAHLPVVVAPQDVTHLVAKGEVGQRKALLGNSDRAVIVISLSFF